MNGRRLFREYAQSKGREAKEFVEIKTEYDYWVREHSDILITKDNKHQEEKTELDYKDMVHWIIRTKKFE